MTKLRRSERRVWEDKQYLPQVAQLRNFFRFVSDCGLVPKIVETEDEARAHIKEFLRKNLDIRLRESVDKPFKGLESYDVSDLYPAA